MIILAVLLLALAIFLIVTAVVEGGGAVTVEAFNNEFETTTLGVFLAGVGTGLIVLAGVVVLRVGVRKVQARRREIEYLRQKVAEQDQTREETDSDEPFSAPPADSWGAQDSGYRRRGRPAEMP